MSNYHVPVMLKESIDALQIQPDGIYVDATYGGGGHSKKILEKLTTGKLIAFDRDPDAAKNEVNDSRLIFVNDNFSQLEKYVKLYRFMKVDGILADFGISSWQIDAAERGFSTRFDAELDMRMDSRSLLSAKDILNTYDESQLSHILKEYGDIINGRQIARAIIAHRTAQPFKTTFDLKNALSGFTSKADENKFFAKIFQAIRIEVNKELEEIKAFLTQAENVLNPKGRLVCISYHSLEDRLVKNYMKAGNESGEVEKDFFGNPKAGLKVITKKPMLPTEEEIKVNSRARSAKLRIAEKA
ncbi:MAG: 16S rRNA (cytosine(1402)-N(4))-methyltransferase RsmH [Flavobacteriales bacterium]